MKIVIELKNEKVSSELKEIFKGNKHILEEKPIIIIFSEAIESIGVEE